MYNDNEYFSFFKRRLFMRKFFIVFLILQSFMINATDYLDELDTMLDQGKYKEGLSKSLDYYKNNSDDLSLVWRVSSFYYFTSTKMSDKNDAISTLDDGINFTKKFIDNKNAEKSTLARINYWYAVLNSEKSRLKGIKASLDMIPTLRELAEKARKLDPSFSGPYHLVAMIDYNLPGLFGGDKFMMGVNIMKAIENDNEDVLYKVDAAEIFYSRNWDVNKKQKETDKQNIKGNPLNKDDREVALDLLNEAFSSYKRMPNPPVRVIDKMKEAEDLLKKLN